MMPLFFKASALDQCVPRLRTIESPTRVFTAHFGSSKSEIRPSLNFITPPSKRHSL